MAWALINGAWPDHIVDHENCDPSDNRWVNLRAASISENNTNRSVLAGEVPFKGVYRIRKSGRYGAQIKKNRQHTWLGLFDTPEEAARAYDRAAIQLHGEYAKTNSSLGLL
ncbi:HNH endonuclease [Aquamicrobium sp. cd-1]|uniref:HNH endonuclease n=1 Tax=Aquamicrobium zhengzhouense TaxID=2781738 RepID=A0ABS0SA10_9HYPH|nr:HNH endonuclease [Aquamicrobium zhengzhouense]